MLFLCTIIKTWYQFLFLFSQDKLFLKEWLKSPVQRSAPGHRRVFRNPGTRHVQVDTHPRAGLAKECPAAPNTGHIPTSLVVIRCKALLPLPDLNNLWKWQFPVEDAPFMEAHVCTGHYSGWSHRAMCPQAFPRSQSQQSLHGRMVSPWHELMGQDHSSRTRSPALSFLAA